MFLAQKYCTSLHDSGVTERQDHRYIVSRDAHILLESNRKIIIIVLLLRRVYSRVYVTRFLRKLQTDRLQRVQYTGNNFSIVCVFTVCEYAK